jgi:hypothetical protein
MKTPSSQPPYKSRARVASGNRSADNPNKASRRPTSDLANSGFKVTDDDSDLIVLGKQFEAGIAKVRALYDPASPDHLERIETMLANLAPVEQEIMATPARTMAGLGVKAHHAAYVISELWDAPIDDIDWDSRAIRSLIEAVCDLASVPLSFESNLKENE